MIELRPLRQFVAVAEELHFGRAAARLAITQPPLTLAIQGLERQLEVRLFDRSHRTVALTPAGVALLAEARRLLASAEALPRAVRAAADGQAGSVRLAFVSSIAYGPLPGWLRQFRDAYPGVQLQLREATLDVQQAAFAAGDIDAGFVLHAPQVLALPGLGSLPVLTEPMWLALPEGHPALLRGSPLAALRAADLRDTPLLIFPRAVTPSLYDALLSAQSARGWTPHIAQEAIQMQTLVNLVSAGLGVAWVPESITRLQRLGVAYRRPPGATVWAQTSLMWRTPPPPVVERFVQHVQAAVQPSHEVQRVRARRGENARPISGAS
jgi:DNA-binding transcriptional LysR family regulator